MPTYTFEDIDTEEVFEVFMSNSERELFLAGNPHIKQRFTPMPTINPTIDGKTKPDNCFRDILTTIKKRHSARSFPSNINTF